MAHIMVKVGEEALNKQLSGYPMWRRMEVEILIAWPACAGGYFKHLLPFVETVCVDDINYDITNTWIKLRNIMHDDL